MQNINNHANYETSSSGSNPPPSSNKLALIAAILAAIALLGCIALVVWNMSLKNQLSALQKENESLHTKTETLTTQQKKSDSEQAKLKKIALLSYMSHNLEDAVVTNDFVIDKIYFTANNSGEVESITIDLENQPMMALVYEGDGVYSISNQAVSAKASELIKTAKEYYGSDKDVPAWTNDTTVKLTVKNYDLGEYAKGSFKLAAGK
ncbi:hypothetical protein [Paenibacillus bovis]|uniref:Uncharacterized protein n=1 Tax=Paenibacillus bovis TaxID=1616788 RepID=A0A172ZJ62_9BACL|nr:hypothetical protein [Paenibacillus bovis]ANF97671.1 hypothetical protein AR543_17755 [Paenibacillus bovis]